MAKVRVRALARGYDGEVRREPGDEFDFDIELFGQGTWFEIVNEPLQEAHEERTTTRKKRSKRKVSSRKSRSNVDDLLA